MPDKNLPETYKGYSTEELLSLHKRARETGSLKGEPLEKRLAMSDLLVDYRLIPEVQHSPKL